MDMLFQYIINVRLLLKGSLSNILFTKHKLSLICFVLTFGSVQFALAVDECGTVLIGGTATCSNDGTPATDANPYATGIRYNIPGITLNLDNITVIRPSGHAIILDGNNALPITLNSIGTVDVTTGAGFGIGIQNTLGAATLNYNNGTISTGTGTSRVAIYARTNSSEAAIINYGNGSITTLGDYSYSVNAFSSGTGDVVIDYNNGVITTSGLYAGGPYGRALGDGNSTITYSSGTITSSGDLGFGMLAQTDGVGNAKVDTLAGTINTSGSQAAGIHAYAGGSGKLDINVSSPVQVNTSGDFGWGILGTVAPNTNTQSLTINNAGLLNTTGTLAHAIWAWHGGTGDIIIKNSNNISAIGTNSDGIRAEANTTSTYQVNATLGTIKSGSGIGAGIHTIGISGGTVNINPTVTIDGSNSNIALHDENGDVITTTSGILTGQVILSLGNDVFNLMGGSLNGDIYTDDVTASAADGDDQFNWSGGSFTGSFNGQNGSDLTSISGTAGFDGSQILNGGDDLSIADTWIDELTFQNITSSIIAANILNWEKVNIDNSTLTLTDNVWAVGDGSIDTGLHILNNGILDASTSGLTLNGNLINDSILDVQDNDTNDTITINGDYSGNGTVKLDVFLNNGVIDDTDVLHITGHNSAITLLDLQNIGGTGDITGTNPTDGILMIQVDDITSSGTFTLSNSVRVGYYLYQLVQNPTDGNWYLQSDFSPISTTPTIPTLNQWALALLIFLLGIIATLLTRRTNRP